MDVSWMTKYIAEGLGTMLLVLLGNGTIAGVTLKGSKNEGMGGLAIAWGYGIAMLVPVLAFANVSGAHINPAITLGLASAGLFPWAHVAQYILAQLIGAIIGQLLVVAIYKEYFAKTNDGAISLGAFATTNALDDGSNRGKAIFNGFVNEVIGMFVFVFGILSFTTNFFGSESIKWMTSYAQQQGADITSSGTLSQIWASVSGASSSKMVGALAIGLMFVGLVTAFGGPTGAALNPARDLGPRIVYSFLPQSVVGENKDAKWWYAWVPVVATIVGAVIAATVFKLMFK
ncbi:Glycerol uptake facilitator related permease (Major Intrinsic Protein Family) [Lactococcus cremoris subsp. cremoris SK11]|uniref:Glycerol uptake facilitator related permease (Major Intrinsic Protein Family) n=2 Tax=Lactococcus lactis subsp. cremoris TaxID=1359 RepID=Q02XU4_LACLS|nr:MIP/aquaporin family protein [Lactococcus cremoris]ABJ73228.1 Glycerol uptake facilitator related permease (Major Intrinsic Protein Family) [Lactococcus cremoris subsp. cremoris SK11]AEU40052.1 Glycerol uptake facilitator protein [Lactococcus cremoris subsp. cremoris A76]ARE23839.1 MIP/aquaporin family protein [Lactococcus cremoris]KZK49075.1 Glycerol uptake facilitator protein [Lactococcus cremoris]KZK54690.1 Glycerol uptake facilitator protein [Lactococcus cremoris]